MTNTEVKKALYKQKPIANLQFIRVGVAYYEATIKDQSDQDYKVKFEVPCDDMGDADYFPEMDGKLLNRYIVD